jgi:hypothetical protein
VSALRRWMRRFTAARPDVEEMQSLQRLGITAGVNLMLLARVETLEHELREIEQLREENPLKYVEKVDNIIRLTALPWYRAASRPELVNAIAAWGFLVGTVKKLWADLSRGETDAATIERLKKRFNAFVTSNLYPLADVMFALAFGEEDVTPQYVNVIRSNVASQAGTGVIVPAELEKQEAG